MEAGFEKGSIGEKIWSALVSKGDDTKDDKPGQNYKNADTLDKYTCELIGWEFDDIGQPYLRDAINRMSLSEEAEAAFNEIKRWKESEDWFKKHGIPWKMGLLLTGKPGTGKTEFARSIAQTLDMPIFFFDLGTMTNQDFVEAWSRMMDWLPCMALFEDIHKVFDKGKNITAHGQEAALNFDCFINVLDGVQSSDGVLTVITANDADLVDTALGGPNGDGKMLTRPGRVNRILEFGLLSEAGRLKMARRILGDYPNVYNELVKNNVHVTGAQFQSICVQTALELWRENKDYAPQNLTANTREPQSSECARPKTGDDFRGFDRKAQDSRRGKLKPARRNVPKRDYITSTGE